jgi:PAS domain S-box-containing protein
VFWEINIIHGLLLASQGIIAALLSMLLGRLARWDRHRIAQAQAAKPSSQESLLAEFCESAAIGMCSVSPNGRVSWANKAELQMLGYSLQDYIGRHVTEFHVDSSSMSEILRRLRSGEEFHEYEARLRCRDGSIKHVLIDTNICRRDGEIVGTRFFTRDITERRNSEAEQHELYSRHESLINCSPSGIFETDSRGKCVFVNDKWCTLTGLTRQQALGVGWKQAIHPEDREDHFRLLQKSLQTGEEIQIDCRVQTPTGVVTWVHGSAVALRSNKNEITGFLGSISDISTLKQAEAVINEARKQAESANRTKSEFLANMSHEMRTPLNGIIGMTELARDVATDRDQIECLETVKESAETLLTLTNELLDFAKVEAGKIMLEHVEFNLSDWMRDSLKPLVFRSRQKGLDFRCLIDSSIPQLLVGDPEWLRHVLINLVSNALKFTDKGFVRVAARLDTTMSPEPEDWEDESVLNAPIRTGASASVLGLHRVKLHFSVQDSGIGIPPEQHETIFAPFEQADKTITRRYGGTGLGLAIARQLSGLMQGKVWLESTVGEGTTFHFTVQLHLPHSKSKRQVHAKHNTSKPSITTPEIRRPLHILVVEDNYVNQRLIVKLLNNRGHKTAVANDGVDALRLLENNPDFDVVLMDMQMPRLSGLETTAEIRKREIVTGKHIPVIALTANVLKGDREKCLAAGMDEYLTKPINREELFDTLAKSVAKHFVPDTFTGVKAPSRCDSIDLDEPHTSKIQDRNIAQVLDPARTQDTDIVREPDFANSEILVDAPQSVPTTSVIDQKALWKRLDGDGELLRELLDGYRDYCPQVLADLRQGVETQDAALVQQSAHQIKGVISNFAAAEAYATARDLERSGRNADLAQAPDMLARLEAALVAVDRELEEMAVFANAPQPRSSSRAAPEFEISVK